MNRNLPALVQARNDIAERRAAKAEASKTYFEKGYDWWVSHGRMNSEPVWPANKPKPTDAKEKS